jgi:hypothetical protein
MRKIFTTVFNSSQRNRDAANNGESSNSRNQRGISPPQVVAEVARAAPENNLAINTRDSAANITPHVEQDFATVVNISLQNLRIGNEPDASLVTIPMRGRIRLPDLTPPADDQTAGLTGKAYLEALGRDARLPGCLQTLCAGRKLARNTYLTNTQLNDFTEKLQLVVSRCIAGSDEFKTQIDALALEAQVFCGDRTAYFIEQMHGMAILDLLTSGGITNDVLLFNLGVAFCKLDLVKNETCKNMATASNQHETIEDVLIAEYLLQDQLGLPVNHVRPINMGTGNITTEKANQIKEAVLAKLLQKDGVHVIDFLSEWEPWVKHVEGLEKNQPDFEYLHSIYAENMEQALENPAFPEAVKIEIAGDYMDRHRAWKRELVGQKSREFLVNYRADCLLDSGSMPFLLTQGAAR